jgi:hypothetical protein
MFPLVVICICVFILNISKFEYYYHKNLCKFNYISKSGYPGIALIKNFKVSVEMWTIKYLNLFWYVIPVLLDIRGLIDLCK